MRTPVTPPKKVFGLPRHIGGSAVADKGIASGRAALAAAAAAPAIAAALTAALCPLRPTPHNARRSPRGRVLPILRLRSAAGAAYGLRRSPARHSTAVARSLLLRAVSRLPCCPLGSAGDTPDPVTFVVPNI